MEYFITGTDTDIGKTFVTKGLALKFLNKNKKVGVYKPLQSGAIKTQDGFLAPDIETVKKISEKINLKYSYLLEGEVSPALAARLANVKIDIEKIKKDFKEFSHQNDITLVEGAGGILAPITDGLLFIDLIKELNIPIIIVTMPFLGRLNHTLLTIQCAKTNGVKIKGLIINKIPENTNDLAVKNFVDELKMYTDVEILGEIKEIDTSNQSYNVQLEKEFSKINLG